MIRAANFDPKCQPVFLSFFLFLFLFIFYCLLLNLSPCPPVLHANASSSHALLSCIRATVLLTWVSQFFLWLIKVVLKAEFSCEGNQVCCQEAAVSQECVRSTHPPQSPFIIYLIIYFWIFISEFKNSPEIYGDAPSEKINNRII